MQHDGKDYFSRNATTNCTFVFVMHTRIIAGTGIMAVLASAVFSDGDPDDGNRRV